MSISDKTRKILWARSGNRCVFCRCPLVMERTASDTESVVGDECHIISKQINGPRSIKMDLGIDLDGHENLLLMCQTHHKMIDDQPNHYSVTLLKAMKASHELWVKTVLEQYKDYTVTSIPEEAELNAQTEFINEIEDSSLDDLTKFAYIVYEHARRNWKGHMLSESYLSFCAWIRSYVQTVGRGCAYIDKDMVIYIPEEEAYSLLPADLKLMIATYDIDNQFVLVVDLKDNTKTSARFGIRPLY